MTCQCDHVCKSESLAGPQSTELEGTGPASEEMKPVVSASVYQDLFHNIEFPSRELMAMVFIKWPYLTAQCLLQVILTTLSLLRYPIPWLIFICIVACIFQWTVALVRDAICPVFALSFLCPGEKRLSSGIDYPRLMEIQAVTFETMLDSAIGGSSLSLRVKQAEVATTDLIALVRESQLSHKEAMARQLSQFVRDARDTGRALQGFGARVRSAVDRYPSMLIWRPNCD